MIKRDRKERAWSTEERETEGLLKDEEQFGSADHDHADGRSGRKTNGDQSAGSRRHSRRPPTAKFSTPKEKPTPVQPVQDYQATGSKQQRLVEKKQEQKQQQTHQSPSHHRQTKEHTAITLEGEDNKNDKNIAKKEPTKQIPPMQNDTGVIFVSNRPACLQLSSSKPQIYSHFKLACFAMLCCCCPIGFIALVNSCKVMRYNHRGDQIGASKCSLQAKRRAHQSFKVCGFLWICFVVLLIAASFIMILVIHPALFQ